MKTDERMCKRAYSSFLVSSLKLFICSVQPEGSVISLMVFIRYAMPISSIWNISVEPEGIPGCEYLP